MVKGRFQQDRPVDVFHSTGQQLQGSMGGEGAGIVIGVTSFVWVRQHRFRCKGPDLGGDRPGQLHQVKARALIRHALRERGSHARRKTSVRQRRQQLLPPRLAVRSHRDETMVPGIDAIARRAVRNRKQAGNPQTLEPGPERDYLIIRVGQNNQQSGKLRTAARRRSPMRNDLAH